MISVNLDPNDPRSLVDQIVDGIRRQIDERCLRPGTKLPSIRKLAESHGTSRFTAVEPYDRLVAQGYLEARRGAGFFTASLRDEPARHAPSGRQKPNEELVWLVRRLLEAREGTVLAGGPWLPDAWMDETGIRRGLSALARKNGAHLRVRQSVRLSTPSRASRPFAIGAGDRGQRVADRADDRRPGSRRLQAP